MEGFWRAAYYAVDCVRCASHSWLVCPSHLGGALAKRRDNLLLPRVAMGSFPYSVWPHGLVSILARVKPTLVNDRGPVAATAQGTSILCGVNPISPGQWPEKGTDSGWSDYFRGN